MSEEFQSGPQLDQAEDALNLSRKALQEVEESARLSAQANEVKFESLSEVGNFLRQERTALQAMLQETQAIANQLLEALDGVYQVRNSLIEEYETQQEITQILRSQQNTTPLLREQEPEAAPKPSVKDFFKNG